MEKVLMTPELTMDNTKPFLQDIGITAPIQDLLNERTFPNWKQSNNDYALAFIHELVELQEHYGWKWWKKHPDFDRKQCFLEVVDAYHFWLSLYIKKPFSVIDLSIIDMWPQETNKIITYGIYIATEHSLGISNSIKQMFYVLVGLTLALGYTHKDLVNFYLGKNALNLFRQANGYKDGTYIKDWYYGDPNTQSKPYEDNMYLERLIASAPDNVTLQWYQEKLADTYIHVLEYNCQGDTPDGL